jgi:DNA-binding MurR/RpiR family transcriptional regulator
VSVPDGAGDVRDRIERAWSDLTPSERQVAEFVLERADDLAGFTGAELAERSGASKATVSRFFRRLGFTSFAQARADARSMRARGVPLGALPAGGADPVATHVAHDGQNLARAAESLARNDLTAIVELLAGARRVLVVGWRNSYPVALHLREQLLQARTDVSLAPQPGQTVAEEVAGLDADDVVVVVAFRRRTPAAAALLRYAAAQGVPVVLLTDPTGPFPSSGVVHRVAVPVDGPGAFDSYAAVMTTVAVLADGVLARRGSAGRRRVREVVDGLDALAELDRS